MYQPLTEAEVREGHIPTVEQRNALARGCIARRVISTLDLTRPGGTSQHNWRVTTSRFAADPSTWVIHVGAGCVNDQIARIRYTKNDERWIVSRAPGSVAERPLVDRALTERDRPVLFATAPARDGSSPGSFRRVGDHQRPRFFRTRAMWGYDLHVAAVTVSGTRPAAPEVLMDIPSLPTLPTLLGVLSDLAFREILASLQISERIGIQPLRAPYLVHVGPQPASLDGTEVFRLADLWLVRAPGAPPENDRAFVQQRCFWSMQAFSILEDQAIQSILPVLQATGPIGNLVAQDIFRLLLDAAKIRWWTKG